MLLEINSKWYASQLISDPENMVPVSKIVDRSCDHEDEDTYNQLRCYCHESSFGDI